MSRTAGIALLAMLFTTGFVLMGFEMLGSRYLNPYFGGGVTTWASLISIVLLAMMVGYMGGGTIADRSVGLVPMAIAIFLAGVNMLAVAFFADSWMEAILDNIGDGFWGVLVGSFVLCFVAIVCLAGLSPYVVKLLLREISHGGRITGLVYSVSTAGNIVGTLATTFWLIPAIGTRSITRIFAVILIVLAVVLIVQSRRRIAVATMALLVALPSVSFDVRPAQAETVSHPAFYPEGPLWVGDTLYYAEMTAGRISRIIDGKRTDFWRGDNCGPTAITEFSNDAFAIACHLGAKVLIVSRSGEVKREITNGADDRALRNPNDINSQGGEVTFFSDPGPFDPNANASGRVYAINRTGRLNLIHPLLKYPNGVAYHAATKRLYVSEHLAKRVWFFEVRDARRVLSSNVLIESGDLLPAGVETDAYSGPDGLRIDADGSVYIAVYGAGLIVHRKADGTMRHIQVPMKYVTSIALSPKQIAITGANDNQSRPYPGQVIVVDRGTFEGSDRIGF
ncbi:MAG: fused MFS/spermidine synthase [Rhizobiaceae bacterium]